MGVRHSIEAKALRSALRRLIIGTLLAATAAPVAVHARPPRVYPADGARNVNPDAHLVLSFDGAPQVGSSGTIRIYDAADRKLVDTLDLAVPASPNPAGRVVGADGSTKAPRPPAPAGPANPAYQATRVGGSWFHFFPIIVRGNRAIIYPHHGALKYGRRYIVKMDASVLRPPAGEFHGFGSDRGWTFSTKAAAPRVASQRLVVSADGTGDFDTVQGAIDFVPDNPSRPVTIFIRDGNYEEIVYINKKSNLVLRGESRDGTVVGYANNSAFNRIRPAFSIVESHNIQLSTFTIRNYFIGQAEALLIRGERNIIDRMTLNGSGDAMTTGGTIYMVDSLLTGDGDTILGYASLFCLRCEIRSVGPFTWTRTPQGIHGNVFIDSTFIHVDRPLPWSITAANPDGTKTEGVLARLPRNGRAGTPYANFPFAEMVLIDSRTKGIPAIGWGPIEPQPDLDWSNLRLWEFNTMDLQGRPIDLSQRHPVVRRLKLPDDAALIARYRDPAFVLGGWVPKVR